MARVRMHADEVFTDVDLVTRLIGAQFPQWRDLTLTPVPSYGTDHDIYRLGDELSVRLPRIGWALAQADKEARWLPVLAPQLPLAVPVQVTMGEPDADYPYRWSVYEWLAGSDANGLDGADERHAVDLAAFVTALRRVDTAGAHPRPDGSRGGVLTDHDDSVRADIAELGDRVDAAALLDAWQRSVEAPRGDEPDVWLHGDLLPGNLLVDGGRLSAVIDWGGLNVGDPACDLMSAWNVFTGVGRDRFRAELDVDDASWQRGRGWVLVQALGSLPYYWDTNPGMKRLGLHALREILAD